MFVFLMCGWGIVVPFLILWPDTYNQNVFTFGNMLCAPNSGLKYVEVSRWRDYPYQYFCRDGMQSGRVSIIMNEKERSSDEPDAVK